MKFWTGLFAVGWVVSSFGAANGESSPPERNRSPYSGVQWDQVAHIHTTSHGHFRTQATLDRGYADGMRFFTISNYYPSAPWWPMKDIREHQFHVRQEHANVVKGQLAPGPFGWNAILMDPNTGWADELPEEQRKQLPFEVGERVFTNIPDDILEAPNAEHHSFTNSPAHICAPGSAYCSGNFDARSRFKLKEHGYGMGVNRTWEEGFRRMIEELIVPDGGGITVNHPVWSKLSDEAVSEMLDFDPRVLGTEIFNHGCVLQREPKTCRENEELWDRILATGRQCFGFFVPDHRMQGSTDWRGRNVLLVPAFAVEDCLRAYRRGDFYGVLRGTGLQLTEFTADHAAVRVKTNSANKIEFITERGVAFTVMGSEGEYKLPLDADGRPDVTFVRVKAYDTKDETLFTQPILYRTQEEVNQFVAAHCTDPPSKGVVANGDRGMFPKRETKSMPDFDYAKLSNPVWRLPEIHLRDPAVLVHDGVAYLYFTYYDPDAKTWHIGISTTKDFIDYTPIEIVSPSGYASPGNVIRTDKGWALCYQQYGEFPHYLCLAFSEDLRTWSEPKKIFNTGPENTWNVDKRVIDPFLVEWNGTYYCYYTGSTRWGRPAGHNLIGVCASDDLETWRDLSPDQPVIGVDHEWEQPDGNENNCVIRHQDRWFMLYSAGLQNQKIAYAWSDDLIHWDKGGLCDVPILEQANTGFGAPVILEGLSGADTFHMLYQGRDESGHMSFFLLESNDLTHWK